MNKIILVWAVREKGKPVDAVTTSYNPWLTQQEAIDGISKLRGKSWETLQKEGAQLIQRKMTFDDRYEKFHQK